MDLQGLPASRDSEVLWVSLEPEERGACWECRVLLYVLVQTSISQCFNLAERLFNFWTDSALRVHQENLELLGLRVVQDRLAASVYQEPRDHRESLALRFVV